MSEKDGTHDAGRTGRCPTCGATIKKHYQFCPGCGRRLSDGTPSRPVCPLCGQTMEVGMQFCTRCGTQIYKCTSPASDSQDEKDWASEECAPLRDPAFPSKDGATTCLGPSSAPIYEPALTTEEEMAAPNRPNLSPTERRAAITGSVIGAALSVAAFVFYFMLNM